MVSEMMKVGRGVLSVVILGENTGSARPQIPGIYDIEELNTRRG
jgi:hypothetical protein